MRPHEIDTTPQRRSQFGPREISDTDFMSAVWDGGKCTLDSIWDLPREEALVLINHLQHIVDYIRRGVRFAGSTTSPAEFRQRAIGILVALCRYHKAIPRSLFVSGVVCANKLDPKARGGFADIFLGRMGNVSVALKRPRIYTSNLPDFRKALHKLCREATLWRQLDHPHVLPFLGVDTTTFGPLHALVAPWCHNGNLLEYLHRHGDLTSEDILTLLSETAKGLAYLHQQAIVHGDLRAANILIDDYGHARLADFGLTFVSDYATSDTTSVTHTNPRWLSPELLDGRQVWPSTSCDMYAWGCVCFEAYTLQRPFWYIIHDAQVILWLMQGHRARRPTLKECAGRALPDDLWTIMERCTSPRPEERPSACELLALLAQMARPPSGPFADLFLDPAVVPTAALRSPFLSRDISSPTPDCSSNRLSTLTLWGDQLPPFAVDLDSWATGLRLDQMSVSPRFILRLKIRIPWADVDDVRTVVPLSGIQGTLVFAHPWTVFAHCSTFVHWKGSCVSRTRSRLAMSSLALPHYPPVLPPDNLGGQACELPASALRRSSLWLDLATRITITQRIEADGEVLAVFVYDIERASLDDPLAVVITSAQRFTHWEDFIMP